MGRCKVDTCFTFVHFVVGAFFCGGGGGGGGGYSNLLLVHLWLKHRGNVFFG